MDNDISFNIEDMSLDDQFEVLLHKKIMNKQGSSMRRQKKYYKDQYKKTGIIPKPLQLVKQGILDGRKCSGRHRTVDPAVEKRFVEMIKASCDHDNPKFIFITRNARFISNFHKFLEDEFAKKISLAALRRFITQKNLKHYLEKPDYGEDVSLEQYNFSPRPVFDLIQMDGCAFRYFKIRDDASKWRKPQVIEFFDTGSRYMLVLDAYFSESSLNSVDLFTQFLLSTAFPCKLIAIRPDNAGGFLNLKRPINEINLKHSLPDGFYLKADFAKVCAPKDKAHLESSHRSLHAFEIQIIKAFEDRIVKTEPGVLHKKNGKIERITVTLLNIELHELRNSGVIEQYRRQHNTSKHQFTENGQSDSWVPETKFDDYLSRTSTFSFSPLNVKGFMKYGYKKINATVTIKRKIRFQNKYYYVADGIENFSRLKSTKVKVSKINNKLLIFENKKDGILIGEAMCQKNYEPQITSFGASTEKNEVERLTLFLEQREMRLDQVLLIKAHEKGLTLDIAKQIYAQHQDRYANVSKIIKDPSKARGQALFNAFLVDYERHQRSTHVAPYALYKEE